MLRLDVQELKFSKRESEAAYKFLSRHGDEILAQMEAIAFKPIKLKDAAEQFDMDPMSFLIFLGHLKKIGIIKEVNFI
ncbi:MAG: hypothetical protein QW455_04005 [Archaeoglobaceae archaeon]